MRRTALLIALAWLGCGGGGGDAPGGGGRDAAGPTDAAGPDAPPPVAAGCITEVGTGDHRYTCGGLAVDVRIPAACQAPGCGVILELHGDTGTGLLIDEHLQLRERAGAMGFIVVAPTGPPYGRGEPGSTWSSANDAGLVELVEQIATVFRADRKRLHVTGFSRGGFATWRLLCDHPDLFASAAPAGAGFGNGFGEDTCFHTGRTPATPIPFLLLMGRTDVSVGYRNLTGIRDAAVSAYGAVGPVMLAGDASYRHDRWTAADGTVIETFDHAYETLRGGPFGSARGHCIPGSPMDPRAPQYAVPCELPNAFTWGDAVLAFFVAHPKP